MTTSSSSLDLTVYGGQITQQTTDCWPGSEKFATNGDYNEVGQQFPLAYDLGIATLDVGAVELSSSQHHQQYANYHSTTVWDSGQQQKVLSILEPGLDFEGLIDLDNL